MDSAMPHDDISHRRAIDRWGRKYNDFDRMGERERWKRAETVGVERS
jgi:hypothetical protein